MRRRDFVRKETQDGYIEKLQSRAGLVRSEGSGKQGERQGVGTSGEGHQVHGRRHSYVSGAEDARRHLQGRNEVLGIPVKREELGPIRRKLSGVCRHCGRHIGRGVYGHERACVNDDNRLNEAADSG